MMFLRFFNEISLDVGGGACDYAIANSFSTFLFFLQGPQFTCILLYMYYSSKPKRFVPKSQFSLT